MTLNELLLEWSYRSEKGYPNVDSPSDISILKQILKELNLPVDEIISNLEEAATTMTEELHEIFVAIFVAGHVPLSLENFNKIPPEKWDLDSLDLLKDPKKHVLAIKKWKNQPEKWEKKAFELYTDAESLAKAINQKLGYPEGLNFVSRVFPESTKPKGDIYTSQNKKGFKDEVQISLKYKKGQFNSLSASELVGSLYDVPTDVLLRKGTGLLGQIYEKDQKYSDKIDRGVQEYLKFIINNYKDIDPEIREKNNIDKLDDFDKNLLDNITWTQWRSMKEWHKSFQKAYSSPPLTKRKSVVLDSKKVAINSTIEEFLEDNGNKDNRTQEQIRKVLTYVLGADPENSYFYAADGGKKMTWIPSQERLKRTEFILDETIVDTGASYNVTVAVKEKKSKLTLFEFDLILRFSSNGGQYTGDFAQKGVKFDFEEYIDDFNRVFYTDPS
jgi:uncharacterized protein (UPF0147 family)